MAKKPYTMTKKRKVEMDELCDELTMFAASQNYDYNSDLMTRIYKIFRDMEENKGGEING